MGSAPDDDVVAELFVQAERTAARLVGRARAEDVASEAVIRALVRWSRISGYPQAWVTRVATNLAIDLLRKDSRVVTGTRGDPQPTSFEGDAIERIDVVRDLKRLSRRQRQVIVLHYLAGLSEREVSDVLGLSIPTVKTHLSRALRTMRRHDGGVKEESDVSVDPA